MTLQQLTYFLAAAEHGSFSAAAEALFMSQPSLSEQVRKLEDELGVPLFIRLGRGLALTEAGRTFLPHAERTLADAAQATASVAEVRGLRAGTASFGTLGDAGYYLLGDLAADFRARYPDVRLRIIGQNSSEVADQVREGRLEAALVVLPIDDDGLEVRPAMQEEVLYTSADEEHVARPMTIERLANMPLILYDARYGWEDPTRRQLAERAQRAGVSIRPILEIEQVGVAVELAARGVGDTIVGRRVAAAATFPKRLRTAPFRPALKQTFAFIQRRGARLSPATRELVAMAEARVKSLRELVEAD